MKFFIFRKHIFRFVCWFQILKWEWNFWTRQIFQSCQWRFSIFIILVLIYFSLCQKELRDFFETNYYGKGIFYNKRGEINKTRSTAAKSSRVGKGWPSALYFGFWKRYELSVQFYSLCSLDNFPLGIFPLSTVYEFFSSFPSLSPNFPFYKSDDDVDKRKDLYNKLDWVQRFRQRILNKPIFSEQSGWFRTLWKHP